MLPEGRASLLTTAGEPEGRGGGPIATLGGARVGGGRLRMSSKSECGLELGARVAPKAITGVMQKQNEKNVLLSKCMTKSSLSR